MYIGNEKSEKLLTTLALFEAVLLRVQMHTSLPIIPHLSHPHAPQMIHTPRKFAVMVEHPPSPAFLGVLHDAMVVRPADHRLQQSSFIRKWPERIIADGVADIMRIACRIAKVIFAVVDVHPGRLEEAAGVVVCEERFVGSWVEDLEFSDAGGVEFEHVAVHAGTAGAEGVDAFAGGFGGTELGGVEEGGVLDGGVAL